MQTFENETTELVTVTYEDEEIVATPTHPFYVPQKGWTEAINLRAGDILVTSNGEYVVVEQIQHEILETPATVYNFEVEDYHTYYVSANADATDTGILVHNKCAISPTSGKITGYTDHGLKSAMGHDGHGIKPSAILDIVRNPSAVIEQTTRGTIKYVSSKGVVVLNKAGKIVTTFAKSSAFWRY